MAAYFFDSSAIVKRYLEEPGSDWVLTMVQPPTLHRILLARITSVETASAIVRSGRGGRLSTGEAVWLWPGFAMIWPTTMRLSPSLPESSSMR